MSNETKECNKILVNEALDAKLCRAIEVFPCLYDSNSKLYRNRRTCDAAWEAISKRCNDSIINCKRRWIELYKTFVLSNVDGNISTQIKPIFLEEQHKQHLHDCLRFLIPHIPLSLDRLHVDNCKQKKDSDPLNNSSKEVVIQRDEISSIETINESKTIPSTPNSKGECDDSDTSNELLSTLSNNAKNNNPLSHCQNSIETVIIKDVDWANKNTSPGSTSPKSSSLKSPSPNPIPDAVTPELKFNQAETKISNFENEEEGKRYNFRRHCKRRISGDDEIAADKAEKRNKISSSPRLGDLNGKKSSSFASAARKLEVKVARMSISKKLRPLRPTKDNSILKINQSPSLKNRKNEDHCTMSNMKRIQKHCFVQTEADSLQLDNEFLHTIRTQMNLMNARQSLHFKFKVYKSLMDVLDDASNFPNGSQTIDIPPSVAPRYDTTTNEEMHLIRELVALVQASKQTAMTSNSNEMIDESKASANDKEKTSIRCVSSDTSTHTSAKISNSEMQPQTATLLSSADKIVTQSCIAKESPINITSSVLNDNEGGILNVPRHIIRKVVKVGGANGSTILTQDGEKNRVYRIYPKVMNNSISTPIQTTQRVTYTQGTGHSGSRGGKFYIAPAKDYNNHMLTASLASASSTASISSTTQGNPIRTVVINNNSRNASLNNLNKTIISKSTDINKTVLSASGAQSIVTPNNSQRGSHIRIQPQSQTLRRYSSSSSTFGSSLAIATNLTNGTNYSNGNATSMQKVTVVTPQSQTSTVNSSYRTVITNRRGPLPLQNVVRSNSEMTMVRSMKSIVTTCQSNSTSYSQMCPTVSTNSNTISTTVNTLIQPIATITSQASTQQEQQQQQISKVFLGKSNNESTALTEVKIKTEPLE